jgi:hypothetical protein
MPALAALSLIVSCTRRIALVWRSNCSMRASMISTGRGHVLGGLQHLVHADAGAFQLALEHEGQLHLHAGAMKRSAGMSPGSKNMSSSSVP